MDVKALKVFVNKNIPKNLKNVILGPEPTAWAAEVMKNISTQCYENRGCSRRFKVKGKKCLTHMQAHA